MFENQREWKSRRGLLPTAHCPAHYSLFATPYSRRAKRASRIRRRLVPAVARRMATQPVEREMPLARNRSDQRILRGVEVAIRFSEGDEIVLDQARLVAPLQRHARGHAGDCVIRRKAFLRA